MKILLSTVLAQMLSFRNLKLLLGINVCACSTKQVKRLLKDPLVCVFAVLVLTKAAKLQMNAERIKLGLSFCFKAF